MDDDKDPATKRLRYSEPDLKIVIKYSTTAKNGTGDDNVSSASTTNNNDEELQHHEKEYMMYSQVLANLSKFVDKSLSINMKEKQTKVIEFHDVTPEIFELALKFEQETIAARSMSVQDAMAVVEFYDKYEFTRGLALCDRIMRESAEKGISFTASSWPVDFDLYIDLFLLAVRLDLKETKPLCIERFWLMFQNSHLLAIRFSVEQLVKLHPLFTEQVLQLPLSLKVSSEELNSPLFPRFFWEHIRSGSDQPRLTSVRVKGAGKGPSAQYFQGGFGLMTKKPTMWQGQEVYFEIEKNKRFGGELGRLGCPSNRR